MDLEAEGLRYAHEVHEAIDEAPVSGTGLAAFIREWSQKFNVVAWGIRFYRGASLEESRRFQDTTYDVLFLMAFSHPLEMASGPALVSAGISNEWPLWLISSLGAGGAVISMPGLDPLCIVLVGSYFAYAPWRRLVGSLRRTSLSGLQWSAERTGLASASREIWSRLVQTEDRLEVYSEDSRSFWPEEWVEAQQNATTWDLYLYSANGYFQARLIFHHSERGTWLQELRLPADRPAHYPLVKPYLRGLGWNLNSAVKEMMRLSNDEPEEWPLYIDQVFEEDGLVRMMLKDGGIRLSQVRSLKNPLQALIDRCRRKASLRQPF